MQSANKTCFSADYSIILKMVENRLKRGIFMKEFVPFRKELLFRKKREFHVFF